MSDCIIYRSNRKTDTYLYLRKGFDYKDLPAELAKLLGETEVIMNLDLSAREKLAYANITQVKTALKEQGYYLQLPPKESIEAMLTNKLSNTSNASKVDN